ncbi:MAG TPA: agmatinase family protein [Bryobacteraceae bacterium]|nr:agmatinase family protein [Bryobacteraceae bacterium]
MSLFADVNWPRASKWLAGETLGKPAGRLAVIGAPVALGSVTPGRCDLAPAAIRKALERFSTYDLESRLDVRALRVEDRGDLGVAALPPEQAFEPVRDAVAAALTQAEAVVLLGGDNSITLPGVHGMGDLKRCGLLTLDAHFDLRSIRNGLTNGNPVRALLRDGLPGSNIVQIGIQSFANSEAYAQVARVNGIEVIPASRVYAGGMGYVVEQALFHLEKAVDRIYVDLDLDVLDRSYAPACPGSRPGGLAPHHIRQAARVCGAHPKVRVMDLVEIDPERDIASCTVLAAAACLLEFSAGVLKRFS